MVKRIRRYFPFVLLLGVIVSGIGTYMAITKGGDPLSADQDRVLQWILVNLITLIALGLYVAFKFTGIWLGRRRDSVGSRLQMRIIKRFGLVAIVPTIILALFSATYFHFGIHAWFNDRVGTALNESVTVAESYLEEHKKNITADVLAMANDLNKQSAILARNLREFNKVVTTQALLRNLTEAIVFSEADKSILARTSLSFTLEFELEDLSEAELKKAQEGDVVIFTTPTDDRVRAMVKLNNYFDTYLLVGRPIDSNVLQHVEITKGSEAEYVQLRSNISRLQITFSVLFGAVALLLLIGAIWFGMVVSGEMVKPVSRLVRATEKVKAGSLDTRVEEGPENDEIGTLNRAFNRMTGQLDKQRAELVEVNRQIDERRRLIEAVLSGVSSGVISLDKDKNITLVNRSAATLLEIDLENLKDKNFSTHYPEISALIEKAENSFDKYAQGHIDLTIGDRKKSFNIKIVAEEFSDEIEGYIVTFDDITELQSAQRRAAWSDVARRVAHEIKNPLTPIQLASERLKRKYLPQIDEDKETFERYVTTIGRHVSDIRNMVEEFVEFARMPAPVFEDKDIVKILNDAVFSRECANPNVEYEINSKEGKEVIVHCDRGQITQIFTNLIKNAAEAISESKSNESKEIGKVNIGITCRAKNVRISIEDNGPGFPEDMIDNITEPYVTTRDKGTGLGLAIVKKIVEDHKGQLQLSNIKEEKKILGARVTLTFPIAS